MSTYSIADLQNADGDRLEWKLLGEPQEIRPGATLPIPWEPGKLLRVQGEGHLKIDGLDYEVQPGFQIGFSASGVEIRNLRREIVSPQP